MTPIQRFPGGLLELLASKTLGENPRELGAVVNPSIDVLQCYGLSNVEHVSVAGTIAENAGVSITVPPTEWWLLYAMDGRAGISATQTGVQIGIGMSKALTVGAITRLAGGHFANSDFGAGTGGSDVSLAFFAPGIPWLLPPETTLWLILEVLGTDATCDVDLTARVARLQ